VRGEDWFQSVASHVELFNAFGFNPIPYLHTPNICKLDEGKKRKLSKRKDPEADCRFYLHDGYPIVAVKEYLLNLINSNFEDWRRENPTLPYIDFPFSVEKVSSGNPMFDIQKLNDVAKDYIARLNAKEVYNLLLAWAEEYDRDFAEVLSNDRSYAIEVLDIERGGEKPRKDIYKWSMVKDYYNYMFDFFNSIELNFAEVTKVNKELLYKILHTYIVLFEEDMDKTTWFDRVKKLAENHGFATDNKKYKANPDDYDGNLASFCNLIRYAFTGKTNTPDLFSICCVLGKDELYHRFDIIKRRLGK